MTPQQEDKLWRGLAIFMIGVWVIGIVALLYLGFVHMNQPSIVDCFDKNGNKIIGLTCLETSAGDFGAAWFLFIMGTFLIMFIYFINQYEKAIDNAWRVPIKFHHG